MDGREGEFPQRPANPLIGVSRRRGNRPRPRPAPPSIRAVPELPEVETVRRSLVRALRGATALRATLHRPDFVEGRRDRRALLEGEVIADVRRHGKRLAIVGASGASLGVHLGMSGRVLLGAPDAPPPPHTHVSWVIVRDGARGERVRAMHFVDPRRFGGAWTFASFEALRSAQWSDLGPDALAVSETVFVGRLRVIRRGAKAALLDQSVIAGLGNIYADESLHASDVHPTARLDALAEERLRSLHAEVRRILRAAVRARGSTLRDGQYVDATGASGDFGSRLAVYGRAGSPCTRCEAVLESGVIAGRTTVWCPACQSKRPWDAGRRGSQIRLSRFSTHLQHCE